MKVYRPFLLVLLLVLFISSLLQAQSASVTTPDGKTFLLRYNSMIQVFPEPGTGNTIILYGPKYERYISTQNFVLFLEEAECNLIFFMDARQSNRLMAIPPSTIDQVVSIENTKARIFQTVQQSTRLLSYDSAEPFDSIQSRLQACNFPGLSEATVDSKITNALDTFTVYTDTSLIQNEISNQLDSFSITVTGAQFILDTIDQALHGRSLYEAVYEIGGAWYRTFDTTPTAHVDAVVIEVINANRFVVQYDGYFTYPSHPYSIGAQQYVQPNGSYSVSDTAHSVFYGYALNDTLIQIGGKTTAPTTKSYVNDKLIWSTSRPYIQGDIINYAGTQYELLVVVSKAEQPDLNPSVWTPVTTRLPAATSDVYWNVTKEYLSTASDTALVRYKGALYKLLAANSTGQAPDAYPLIWEKITTENPASITYVDSTRFRAKFQRATTNITVSADSIATYENYKIVVKNASGDTTSVTLPNPTSTLIGKSPIVIDSSAIGGETYLVATSGIRLRLNDNFSERYYLNRGESVSLTYTDSTIVIIPNIKEIVYNTTLDFDKRVNEGSKINFKGGQYLVQKALPASGVDNLFIKQVRLKSVFGSNQFVKSREATVHTGGGLYQWNISGALQPLPANAGANATISIYGQKDAGALLPDDTGSKRMGQTIDVGNQAAGTKFTMSFLVKAAEAVSNDNFVIESFRISVTGGSEYTFAGSGFTPNTTDKHWEQYSYTGIFPIDIDTTITPRVYYTADVGDTLYVDNFQFEITPSASEFKYTDNTPATNSDTSYAVYQPVSRLIDLNQIYRDEDVNDNEVIQQALDYCEATGFCDGVVLVPGMVLKDTVLLHENQIIDANDAEIFADLNDDTKSAIFCERGIAYSVGHNIRNIKITALSPAKALINANDGLTQYFTNVTLVGDYDPGVDSVLYGYFLGSTTGLSAIGIRIIEGSITGFKGAGINMLNVGNDHTFKRLIVSRNYIGIAGDGTLITCDQCDVESNTWAQYGEANNKQFSWRDSYIENGAFWLKNWIRFSFDNGRISGGAFNVENDGPGIFSLRDTRASGSFPIVVGTSMPPVTTIANNWFTSRNSIQFFTQYYKYTPGVRIAGNITSDFVQQVSYLGRTHTWNSMIEGVNIQRESSIGDTLRFTNGLTITGLNQNLIPSDTMMASDVINATYEIQNNVVDGTGDLLIGLTDQSGTTSFNSFPILNPVNAGDTVTVYFEAIDLRDSISSSVEMSFRLGPTETYSMGPTTIKKWHPYWITFVAESTVSTLTRRLSSIELGDSVAYRNWQLFRGDQPLNPVNTGKVTGIEDTTISTTIGGNGVWNIVGEIDTDSLKTNSLKDATSSTGTINQVPKADGSGSWAWGTSSIGEHSDVDITSPVDGEMLRYRTPGLWVNESPTTYTIELDSANTIRGKNYTVTLTDGTTPVDIVMQDRVLEFEKQDHGADAALAPTAAKTLMVFIAGTAYTLDGSGLKEGSEIVIHCYTTGGMTITQQDTESFAVVGASLATSLVVAEDTVVRLLWADNTFWVEN